MKILSVISFRFVYASLILILICSQLSSFSSVGNLRVKMEYNTYNSDEAILQFAQDGDSRFVNTEDAIKFFNSNINVYSNSTDNISLAINTFPEINATHITNLATTAIYAGVYHLIFTELASFNSLMQISLYDNFTSTLIPITDSLDYSFTISSNPLSQGTSRFQLIFQKTSVLPVQWLSFNADKINSLTSLKWSTASEKNTSHYIIQKSLNAIEFTNIGNVNAANYSTNISTYQFIDKNENSGIVYYRLLQMDLDGKKSYYKLISVNNLVAKQIKIYPNPATDQITIENTNLNAIGFSLINSVGNFILSTSLNSGVNNLSLLNLPSGVYFFKTNSEDNKTISSGTIVKK